jgi:hypothetical protein
MTMNQDEWREWLRSDDSEVMRQDFRMEATERKVRLFAVACCQRVWHLLEDERSRRAVMIAEQFADGLASESERAEAHSAAGEAQQNAEAVLGENRDDFHSAASVIYHAARAARLTSEKDCRLWVDDVARSIFDVVACNPDGSEEAENEAHCHLLRDLFNPFPLAVDSIWLSSNRDRDVRMDPSLLKWNDRTIPRIAEGIYEERRMPAGTLDTSRLAILADALLDAGCDDEALIAHCRSEGPHVRGCWAIDLILGKK